MPSPISAPAYPAPTTYRSSNVDLFGQGASGQDMAVLAAAPSPTAAVSASEESAPASKEAKAGNPLFGKEGFSFSDFLDIINPLQHIPVVSTVYRALTGDQINPGARLAGGGLYGGPIGLALSVVSGMIEETTGRDPGEHALVALGVDMGPKHGQAPEVMVAEQDSPAIDPSTMAAAQIQAQAQGQIPAPQTDPQMKLGVKMDDGSQPAARRKLREDKLAEKDAKTDGPIELPADLFQALKQTAAAQEADARNATINNASSNPAAAVMQAAPQARSAGPMQTNAMPNTAMPTTAIQPADGRTWFPARSVAVPAQNRGVGTQAVTQQTVQSRYGVTRGGGGVPSSPQAATSAAAAMIQQSVDPQQAEWANKASDAYQKYFDMQNERNRRAGIVQ